MQQEIAERLRIERLRFELSQEEMAKLGGVTARSQRNYESGARSPDAAYLSAVGIHPGVDLQYVLTGVRYEAETLARHSLLIVLAERLGIDLGFAEQIILEAEDFEMNRMNPASQINQEEDRRVFNGLAEKFIKAASLPLDGGANNLDNDLLATVIDRIDHASNQAALPASKRAQAVVTVYLASRASGQVDDDLVRSAIKLAK